MGERREHEEVAFITTQMGIERDIRAASTVLWQQMQFV
jgi:hypothetical protein